MYFYPGTNARSVSGSNDPAEDTAQHLAFRTNEAALRALGVEVVGVSSESEREQSKTVIEHRICHRMLIDPELALAKLLALPIFEHDGRCWYRRLTLLAKERDAPYGLGEPMRSLVIERVFYPVLSAANNPAQIMTWLQIHG